MKIRYLTATALALMLIVPLLNAQDSDAKEKKLSESDITKFLIPKDSAHGIDNCEF